MPKAKSFLPLTDQQKAQIELDLKHFVTHRKRFFAVRRWIEVQKDIYDKIRVAEFITDLFTTRWLVPEAEEERRRNAAAE